MKLEWQQAPVKTLWGDDMVVASVAIDKDHTVCLYCEREQTPKVNAMFAQRRPLSVDEIFEAIRPLYSSDKAAWLAVNHSKDEYRLIEAKHGIKENT